MRGVGGGGPGGSVFASSLAPRALQVARLPTPLEEIRIGGRFIMVLVVTRVA